MVVAMTESLQHAIDRLQQLPEAQQERLAQLLLHEMADDERWQRTTDVHADKLARLAQDVLEADRRG
jgi:hypothetical protein